eukprot:COSAG01_NODE_49075_length_375_cov_0.938406_1_plen_108_part_01
MAGLLSVSAVPALQRAHTLAPDEFVASILPGAHCCRCRRGAPASSATAIGRATKPTMCLGPRTQVRSFVMGLYDIGALSESLASLACVGFYSAGNAILCSACSPGEAD